MSGGSKKQTVGYRYRMGLHMGLCHGPVDAVLEIRVGDRTAWSGEVTESDQIQIDAPNLFGGDEKEGGIQGALDIMMGEDDQAPNDYLVAKIGAGRPAYRGILGLVFRGGLITSNNPYIKPWAVKVRRILQGWKGGSAWYPEKAEVPAGQTSPATTAGYFFVAAGAEYSNSGIVYGTVPADYVATAHEIAANCIAARNSATGSSFTLSEAFLYPDGGDWLIGGNSVQLGPNIGIAAVPVTPVCPAGYETSFEENGSGSILGITEPSVLCTGEVSALKAMNPAHIVYECLTNAEWGMGYDASILDLESFEAAADTFYTEGMGLCMQWTRQESIEQFVQLVLDHAGAVLVEDRRTLLLRLVPLRADYAVEALPHFSDTAGNVLASERLERATVTDTVNEITVSYTDAATGKEGSITVQNLAAVQAAGRVVSQSRSYAGLPTIDLALRVAMRDLMAASSGLARVRLTVNREGYDLVPGDVIRYSWGPDGIADMPLRVLDVDYGSLTDGRVQLECLEDVFGLPETTYVEPQPPGWVEPDTQPKASPAVLVFESPFRELVQVLGRSEAQALPADVGYVAAAAVKPGGFSLNWALYARISPAAYEEAGAGDWCPTGTLDADIGPQETTVVLADATDLGQITVGTVGVLGTGREAEWVRVDAVDPGTSTLTLGRGCLDTVPRPWPAGTRFWAVDEFAAASGTEYVDGEAVDLKAVTRTTSGQLPEGAAPGGSVTLDQRAARPYPPGKLRISDDVDSGMAYPEACQGELTVSWAHRDRLLQDDQLIDAEEDSIGPEDGTTYTVRFYLDGVLQATQSSISGTSAAPYTYPGSGVARVEVEAVRDGLTSWQVAAAEFDYIPALADVRVTDGADTRTTDSGDRRITE